MHQIDGTRSAILPVVVCLAMLASGLTRADDLGVRQADSDESVGERAGVEGTDDVDGSDDVDRKQDPSHKLWLMSVASGAGVAGGLVTAAVATVAVGWSASLEFERASLPLGSDRRAALPGLWVHLFPLGALTFAGMVPALAVGGSLLFAGARAPAIIAAGVGAALTTALLFPPAALFVVWDTWPWISSGSRVLPVPARSPWRLAMLGGIAGAALIVATTSAIAAGGFALLGEETGEAVDELAE